MKEYSRSLPLADRFWWFVDRSGGPDACWEWQGSRQKNGYGTAWDGSKKITAHRLSYQFANGEFDPSLLVCHRCDNPPCVNPAHLFLGTNSDNMQDMIAKGRQPDYSQVQYNPVRGDAHHARRRPERMLRGEAAPWAKLTESDVRDIFHRFHVLEENPSLIASAYGLEETYVYHVANGRSWKHLGLKRPVIGVGAYEFAKRIGRSHSWVCRALENGTISGRKVHGRWRVTE